MKIDIIIFIILVHASMSLHIGKPAHMWVGYAPDCEIQCSAVGQVCDIGKEKVCCEKGKCTSKYGF
jgi:hypothetical protein